MYVQQQTIPGNVVTGVPGTVVMGSPVGGVGVVGAPGNVVFANQPMYYPGTYFGYMRQGFWRPHIVGRNFILGPGFIAMAILMLFAGFMFMVTDPGPEFWSKFNRTRGPGFYIGIVVLFGGGALLIFGIVLTRKANKKMENLRNNQNSSNLNPYTDNPGHVYNRGGNTTQAAGTQGQPNQPFQQPPSSPYQPQPSSPYNQPYPPQPNQPYPQQPNQSYQSQPNQPYPPQPYQPQPYPQGPNPTQTEVLQNQPPNSSDNSEQPQVGFQGNPESSPDAPPMESKQPAFNPSWNESNPYSTFHAKE